MVITRCPDCHARFRVTDGQLKLARGQVRCGACLSVFDAKAHALRESEIPQPTTSAPSSEPANKSLPTPETHAPAAPLAATESTASPAPSAESQGEVAGTGALEPQVQAPNKADPERPAEDTTPLRATAATAAAPQPFRAEPIAFSSDDSDDNPVATTGWLLLSLVAVLGLVAQLLWFERARLADYTELGSVYALLCEQVDCSLTQNALPLIDNQGLHLQPHPKYSDALSATLLLENRAAFSQPWPGLQLRFTDLKGRLVAQRTFQPEEYLDTTSVDPLRMPSGQPVQIELELASPGRRGVSYELKLTPALLASAK
ncbi:hypothetical protein GCM10009104_34490 [Marinobacterium maritimum]|uniref:Zinc finger/thioredoxin putative domain-containing protein n=1 Tax=Marinobacterium maritimum TaxID=500162 RepID=A0ABP3TH14_9GAMM